MAGAFQNFRDREGGAKEPRLGLGETHVPGPDRPQPGARPVGRVGDRGESGDLGLDGDRERRLRDRTDGVKERLPVGKVAVGGVRG